MITVVLDASVVLKWILLDNEELVEEARKLHDRIGRQELRAIAPESILIEVANVMFWKKGFKKEEIISFLNYLSDGAIGVVPFYSFELAELLEVMGQYKLSIYDAYYVLLAKKNDCRVVTLDKKMSKIKGVGADMIKLVVG